MRLLSLVQTTGANLVIAGPLGIEKQFKPLAHLSGEHGALWATREEGPGAEAADNPSRPGGNILCYAGLAAPNVHTIPQSALALRSDSSLVQVGIGSEIDGSLKGFGQRFWTHVEADLARNETLKAIEYADRYLKSPEAAGCSPILSKNACGVSHEGRPKLALLLEVLGARDTVDMLELVREIGAKCTGFKPLAES